MPRTRRVHSAIAASASARFPVACQYQAIRRAVQVAVQLHGGVASVEAADDLHRLIVMPGQNVVLGQKVARIGEPDRVGGRLQGEKCDEDSTGLGKTVDVGETPPEERQGLRRGLACAVVAERPVRTFWFAGPGSPSRAAMKHGDEVVLFDRVGRGMRQKSAGTLDQRTGCLGFPALGVKLGDDELHPRRGIRVVAGACTRPTIRLRGEKLPGREKFDAGAEHREFRGDLAALGQTLPATGSIARRSQARPEAEARLRDRRGPGTDRPSAGARVRARSASSSACTVRPWRVSTRGGAQQLFRLDGAGFSQLRCQVASSAS